MLGDCFGKTELTSTRCRLTTGCNGRRTAAAEPDRFAFFSLNDLIKMGHLPKITMYRKIVIGM